MEHFVLVLLLLCAMALVSSTLVIPVSETFNSSKLFSQRQRVTK